MPRYLPILLLLVLVCVSSHAQSPLSQPTQVRWWRGAFDDAFERAKLRNVPILLAIIQDGEEANERLVAGLFPDKSFVALTEETVPLICSRSDHDTKSQQIDGRTLHVCSKFGHVACTTHRRQEAVMYHRFFAGKQLSTPQVLVVLPDGKIVGQILDVAGPASYRSAVKKAVRKMGGGISRRDLDGIAKRLSLARTALANDELGIAWGHAAKVVEAGGKSELAAKGLELQKRIRAAIDQELRDLESVNSEEDMWKALELCSSLGEKLKGTPLGTQLLKTQRKLKRKKLGRQVAAKMKRQARLYPRWKKALKSYDKSDYEQAYRLMATVAEKGAGLPLGRRAAERLEALEKDEDLAPLLKAVIADRKAAKLLSSARSLLRSKESAAATVMLKKLIKEYPESRAARSARGLLEK